MPRHSSFRTTRRCETCGASFPFYACPSNVSLGRGRFCSKDCQKAWQTIPVIDRFFHYLGKKTPAGCILWAGTVSATGYGVLGGGGKSSGMLLAHRIAYELMFGPIPKGMGVLHRCDNPPCINPAHLFLGDNAANMADKVAKMRQPRGEDMPGARLTEEVVIDIRRLYSTGRVSYRQLAIEYGVSTNVVRCAVKRITWAHVRA